MTTDRLVVPHSCVFCGVDPGLEFSHFGMVQSSTNPGVLTAYGARLDALISGRVLTATDDVRNWDLSALLDALHRFKPVLVAVEVARGSVRGEVAADPIMRNNIVAGALLGFLSAAGFQAVPVSAGGAAAGWNWRSEVGVRGKGAAERDKYLRGALKIRGVESPVGPRGGVKQDAVDALGIAAAAHDRSERRPALSPVNALIEPDTASALVLARERTNRATRKRGRALKVKMEGRYDGL